MGLSRRCEAMPGICFSKQSCVTAPSTAESHRPNPQPQLPAAITLRLLLCGGGLKSRDPRRVAGIDELPMDGLLRHYGCCLEPAADFCSFEIGGNGPQQQVRSRERRGRRRDRVDTASPCRSAPRARSAGRAPPRAPAWPRRRKSTTRRDAQLARLPRWTFHYRCRAEPRSSAEKRYDTNIPNEMEARVSQVTVGKWGKNLAIRLPGEIMRPRGSATASVSISRRMMGKSSSAVRFRISPWRSCFAGRAPKSGGQVMPEPLIGDLMSVVRTSRNDGFDLLARRCDLIWTDFDPTEVGNRAAGGRHWWSLLPRSPRTPACRSSVRSPRARRRSRLVSFCLRACRSSARS
jgi:hypothetical protein